MDYMVAPDEELPSRFLPAVTPQSIPNDVCRRPQFFRAELDGLIYDVRGVWRALRDGAIPFRYTLSDVTALLPNVPNAVDNVEHCLVVDMRLPLLGAECVLEDGSVTLRIIDGWHRIGRLSINLPAYSESSDSCCLPILLITLEEIQRYILPEGQCNSRLHAMLLSDTDTQEFFTELCGKYGVALPTFTQLMQFLAREDFQAASDMCMQDPNPHRLISAMP